MVCGTYLSTMITVTFTITEEKRPLARPRCRWENNIRMVLKEIG